MQRPVRRRSSPLTKERIIRAAIELIDRDGPTALSMRRLGAELGIEAMSLYHHFPNREALVDTVLVAGSPEALPGLTGHWRDDLIALAETVYTQYAAHPKILPLRWERRRSAEPAKAVLDHERRIFSEAGWGTTLARDAHRLIGSYIIGCVVVEGEASQRITPEALRAQFRIGLEMLVDGIDIRRRRIRRPRRSSS
jgi:AcrR family transcriptional regulator